ncbi:uncharacterized protein LOC131005215 [Salvia miltiorrhiza]|uniref:uncharacterized protein LOC131005215 n=1 Tax=Salvia miltiorrhiza TaxID=226208 RepID=UPI0025AD14FF|nr:uncharacterized protein LOC131005215 [Salvia miltiorrhiza]
MGECQEIPNKFLSFSSSENRDSIGSLNDGGEQEFYEKIEAPKFVDFTLPDHYSPDDRYWFCLRVGCDQKHEEEMDSEAIYNNFVLRVMAARSPNVRLRKALDRNASRTPIKCPLSAPPKSSKPRLSRMAVISSISKKITEDKKKVVRPLMKPGSTPVTKTKPVAAKYLTTPRNKKCTSDQTSFRSVQHPKPINIEVPKSRIVAKALVFRSPKKAVKLKSSVELRTPISKLCQGMNKLEISSQRKRALGYSSNSSKNLSNSLSRRQLSSQKLQAKPEKPLQTFKGQEAKSGISFGTKIKGQLSQQQESKKMLGSDETHNLKKKESCDIKKQLATKVGEESCHEGALEHSNLDSGSADYSRREVSCLDVEGRDDSRSEATKAEENNGNKNITSESCIDQFNGNNSSEGERSRLDYDDGDDKENAAVSDENRIPNNTLKQNGRNILGLHGKCDQVEKKVITQAQDILKEGLCGMATKLKKPKATNPKPFRLRTDERGILKEAVLERRVVEPPASRRENATGGKLQRKNVQKGNTTAVLRTPKRQERSKSAESKKSQEPSNAMQRLEKFRKLTSPVPKQRHGVESRKQELISVLIPGQKLDVIHETSPQELSTVARRRLVSHVPRS